MTDREKLRKLEAFLEAQIENLRECAKIFAKSEDYETAHKYKMKASDLETILWMIRDEKFLNSQYEVFFKDEDK